MNKTFILLGVLGALAVALSGCGDLHVHLHVGERHEGREQGTGNGEPGTADADALEATYVAEQTEYLLNLLAGGTPALPGGERHEQAD